MVEWASIQLREIASPEEGSIAIGPFGSAMKADTYSEVGVPIIRGTNISSTRAWKGDWVFIPDAFADAMPRCVVKPDDIVFPHRGSIGEVAIVPPDRDRYFLSSSLMKVRIHQSKAVPLFVYYFFRSNAGRSEILRFASQVGTPGIGQPLSSLRQFTLPIPPLKDQTAIASVLASLDDKIELNRRMNETLEATARTIFKDWFVDFGPTRAKLEGRAPYLAADIWSLFPDRLDDDGQPDGWINSTIGQEVEVVGGSTPSTKEPAFWGGDISWATPKDLSSLSTPVLLSTERQITGAGLSQIGSGLLPVGTVLLSSRAPIGYMAIAQIPVAVNQGFIAMICKKRLSNVFVWLWTQANMETVHQNANGSTFQEISKANFRPIEVTFAMPDLLRVFDDTARAVV
jgi:type I restriction enzyme, S subunit